jgi:predicted enzyme related to lactoylglutathione lyase
MIHRQSHTTVYCLDQEAAKQFYVDKLGFDLREDEGMGAFRWLTVSPKGQRDLELVLMPIMESPMMDAATVETVRGLVKRGSLGCGVLLTDDCKQSYEELRAKGVEFMNPPAERPYGIEALFKDVSGNWWSMVQRPG